MKTLTGKTITLDVEAGLLALWGYVVSRFVSFSRALDELLFCHCLGRWFERP